ncbi:MAG: hypothetical protein ABSD43_12135 [Terracidiphilus sp.]|jgi:hypothetical protein
MSLLHQETPQEIDDAARGEEFTKGSSHVVWATIVATVLVTVVVAVIVIAGQKPPAASGEIEQVWVHPQHTETSGFDANGEAMAVESYDQIYVFSLVKLHNQGAQPLFLSNIMANIKQEDGIHSSYAASAADYDRVFLAYPSMPVPHGKGLRLDSTLDPGQTVEGTIVSAFRMSKQQWDAGKDLSFTFAFHYQPSLVLAPHAAVIVR